MRALYCLLLICSLLALSGCAELNISNPFETKSSDGSEVYFDQFPDVPIPRDMSVDAKRSLISVLRTEPRPASSPSKAAWTSPPSPTP